MEMALLRLLHRLPPPPPKPFTPPPCSEVVSVSEEEALVAALLEARLATLSGSGDGDAQAEPAEGDPLVQKSKLEPLELVGGMGAPLKGHRPPLAAEATLKRRESRS